MFPMYITINRHLRDFYVIISAYYFLLYKPKLPLIFPKQPRNEVVSAAPYKAISAPFC